jgi:hypothetical protein
LERAHGYTVRFGGQWRFTIRMCMEHVKICTFHGSNMCSKKMDKVAERKEKL